MIVILVARKPLNGTVANNALKYGTGGINVDGCRIGNAGGSQTPSGMDRMNARLQEQGYRPGTYQKGTPEAPPPSGRWPANLIFEHKPGCRCVGTQKGPDYMVNTWDNGAKPFGGGAGHPFSSRVVSGGDIQVWDCLPGCPVAELDRQSGDRKAGGVVKGNEPSHTGQNGIYGTWGRVANTSFNDVGGASRFFKQIQDTEENESR